jgi:hypothetical protein
MNSDSSHSPPSEVNESPDDDKCEEKLTPQIISCPAFQRQIRDIVFTLIPEGILQLLTYVCSKISGNKTCFIKFCKNIEEEKEKENKFEIDGRVNLDVLSCVEFSLILITLGQLKNSLRFQNIFNTSRRHLYKRVGFINNRYGQPAADYPSDWIKTIPSRP